MRKKIVTNAQRLCANPGEFAMGSRRTIQGNVCEAINRESRIPMREKSCQLKPGLGLAKFHRNSWDIHLWCTTEESLSMCS